MSPAYDSWLREAATRRATAGLERRLTHRADNARVIDVASNDYLGLAMDPRVTGAAAAAATKWGAGSTGSRLVTGSIELHRDLERALCAFAGSEDALVFSSGYAANLGAITALGGPGSLIVSDADNHASIIDACRLSRSRTVVTPHRDLAAVDRALADRSEARAMVVVDAVFSTDGTTADASALLDICRNRDALLLIDEAHSVGVIGRAGRGVAHAAGVVDDAVVVRTVTLSKALGSQGGAVVGSSAIVEHLVNTARTFIFDTGLAPACAAAARAAIDILETEPERVEQVGQRRDEIATALELEAPDGAVVSLILGDPALTAQVADDCRQAGVIVGCFRPPSVPPSGSRLRITARASLTDVDIKEATTAILEAIERRR
ncbi:MAG TPA: 8-amino-7-oxononanoate synthase [Mycobacteriales bacterium]|nr:8-amino-7-oxononanoate synthase [Mycobacteriales bacterium]